MSVMNTQRSWSNPRWSRRRVELDAPRLIAMALARLGFHLPLLVVAAGRVAPNFLLWDGASFCGRETSVAFCKRGLVICT